MKKFFFILIFFCTVFFVSSNECNDECDLEKPYNPFSDTERVELPKCAEQEFFFDENSLNSIQIDSHEIIEHFGYALCYREKFEVAEWVAYTLDKTKLKKNCSRKNDFREDPMVKTISAQLEDYKASGFDRGHLAPAADMVYSDIAMSESFFLSNMCPQLHSFNAGIWLRAEKFVRDLALHNKKIYVVTGPILEKDFYPTIGSNKVSVPEFFYKVILIDTGKRFRMAAFIIPHNNSKDEIWNFQCTVREVEERTKIDFFWMLDDELENALEINVDFMLKLDGLCDE